MRFIVHLYFAVFFLLIHLNRSIRAQKSPKIEQNPEDTVVILGDPVTLECRAVGEPKPNIKWFKDGKQLSIGSTSNAGVDDSGSASKYTLIHNSNLFIFSTTFGKGPKSDAGVYHCEAENEHGKAQSRNATLTITYLKDDFREIPKSKQVNAGATVTMECKAPRGSPEPSIWWEKNGIQIRLPNQQSFTPYYSFSNSSLVINNASVTDNGEYVCVASNQAGVKRSAPAFLNVFEKPSFTVVPEASKHVANSRVEFECQAKGFPKPQVEWKRDNAVENLPSTAIIRDSLLIIPNVQMEDEGEYTCVASNHLASVEAKAYLIVYEKPAFVKTMPNITIGIESKSLTIECNARGKPSPIIYWAKSASSIANKNDESSTTQDDFLILENGNLFIERVSKKYEGTYLCQASNEYGSIEAKTYLQVKPIQKEPPPIVIYGPQNQTIPINTQAILECQSSALITNANSNQLSSYSSRENERLTIEWFKDSEIVNHHVDNLKYKQLDKGMLQINSVQKSDSGVYKCVVWNSRGKTESTSAVLSVEDPNNQYVEFKRNYEQSALPSAPSQPIVSQSSAKSLTLTWQPSAHSGHSPLRSYSIEYYSPEWPSNMAGWQVLADNIHSSINSFTADELKADTYYMFVVRARNDQGYGPPSQVSELVKTLFEPQLVFRNKNSNELLEKALTGEIIQLNEPAQVLSSTSINITWKIFKSAFLIEGFLIKYKPVGSKEYKSETLHDYQRNFYVLNNLLKFTTYEILIEPFSGEIRGSESNIVQAKTKEDVPSQSPLNLHVEMQSVTSVAIKWQPPPFNHMNGIILGYKIHCVANETKYNLNLNTNATTRAIILGNLMQNMKYCIKVAAYTRVGTGPSTISKCVEMFDYNLKKDQVNTHKLADTSSFLNEIKNLSSTAWFISLMAIISFILIISMTYCLWCLIRHRKMKRKDRKYLSSSENCSLNGPHKLDANGNRYKLVNDAIWMDTLHSGSNQSNPDCCCVPVDLHTQLFSGNQHNSTQCNVHLINNEMTNQSLDKNRFQNLSMRSKMTTMNTNSNPNTEIPMLHSSSSGSAPQYAEIYASSTSTGGPAAYATTGLFLNNGTQIISGMESNNPYNILSYQQVAAANQPKYSSYTVKMVNDVPNIISVPMGVNDQKKLIKYLQATQSQTNTPRVIAKNLSNRVKSMDNEGATMANCTNCCPDPQTNELINASEAIRTYYDMTNNKLMNGNQPTSSSTPIPQLPLMPPPSLASALQQQQQHQPQSHHVQYQMPWNNQTNGNGMESFSNAFLRSNPMNSSQMSNKISSSLLNSLTNNATATLLHHQPLQHVQNTLNMNSNQQALLASHLLKQQSTFTAQQYMNRTLNLKQQQQQQQQQQGQQDYSSISPEDEYNDYELKSYSSQVQQPSSIIVHNSANNRSFRILNPIGSVPIQMSSQAPWNTVNTADSNTPMNQLIATSYDSQQSSSESCCTDNHTGTNTTVSNETQSSLTNSSNKYELQKSDELINEDHEREENEKLLSANERFLDLADSIPQTVL